MSYMEETLGAELASKVLAAQAAGLPILIGGDRSWPTGKSTLAEYLRRSGVQNVFEEWELEEGFPDPAQIAPPGGNYACVHIILDKPIPNPDSRPWFGRT